jgi:cell wall-associated NlpC family hydrolase
VATPHALLTHAHEQVPADLPAFRPAARRLGRVRAGLLIGATAALTVTVLPGTATATPGEATSAADAAQRVAKASHELEVVTEQLNEAKVVLERQEAAAEDADASAAEARQRLDQLDDRIRELARSAYTGEGFSQLDVMLTSDSADDFVHQLGTLDAIAGHTNDLVTEVAAAAEEADAAQAAAEKAETKAQKSVDAIEVQQADLEKQIADYQRQYDRLTAAQQRTVLRAHGGETVAAPAPVTANGAAAQAAVNTALAQVGDPYSWGAGGPDAFDCSGLMQYAYSAAGVSLPHSSRSQSQMGTPVSRDQLQPGDLVFFYSPVSHVGMYIGNGQMVHASTSGQPVKVASLDSMGSYNSARRVAG